MFQFVKNLYAYRELLFALTASNIKTRYKQSLLGVGWAMIQPLALMAIAIVVFSQFARVPSDDIPYPLFVYAALLPWTLHTTALSSAIASLVVNTSLIHKIYFPREIFIISAILVSLIDYLIAAIFFIGMLAFYRIVPGPWLLTLPFLLVLHLLLITGISLAGAIVNAALRDVSRALPLLLQLWMLASPVMYPLSIVPAHYRNLYLLNPMVGIIDGYRKIILQNSAPDFRSLGISAAMTILLVILGYRIFQWGEGRVVDAM